MLIVVAFMFSFILAMTAAFIGAPAISADIESGVLLAILARPIARSTFLAGRWLGLIMVAAGYALAAGLLEILAMKLASGYGPPDPLGAAGAIALQAILVLTLTLFFSTRLPSIAGGAIAVVLFGMCWIAGVLGGLGVFFKADLLGQVATISRLIFPSDGIGAARSSRSSRRSSSRSPPRVADRASSWRPTRSTPRPACRRPTSPGLAPGS